jgi:CO/xanthine dehydrogenase Mo-binding subunit
MANQRFEFFADLRLEPYSHIVVLFAMLETFPFRSNTIYHKRTRRWTFAAGSDEPASGNVSDFPPLSFKELAAKKALTGGPITAAASVNAGGIAPGFSTQFCDVEVDPETGKVTILRFVAAQEVGCAIHPSYVEGQIQGGVAQGIGWALNEKYIYDRNGRLDNAGFLDYRVPVASDMPMIEPILVEVPNPAHPYGAKGVGEVNIVPPVAAIANAIDSAIHRRLTELPMSPPKVRAALDMGQADD